MCVRICVWMFFLDKNVIAIYDVRYILNQNIFKQIERSIRFLEVIIKCFGSFSNTLEKIK